MIAVIAGTGTLPQEACKRLLELRQEFFVICLFPEDNSNEIKKNVKNDSHIFIKKFYKAGEIFELLKKKNTKQVLMIGKVDKRNLLKKVKFDWFSIKFLAKLISKSDRSLLEGIVSLLENEKMKVLKQCDILDSLFVPPGIIAGKLTPEIKENIDFGMRVANSISCHDIGQTVAVKDKMVIAIEAIEGTDNCIKRGIALSGGNLVICKTAHKNQNKKYDLPTLGPKSLDGIAPGDIEAIAWNSKQTFIAEKDRFVSEAQKLKITLVSI